MKASLLKSRRTESKAKTYLSAWRKAYRKWAKHADRREAKREMHKALAL